MQGPESIRKLAAWLAAFALIALGAKLWTIQLWATNLPHWDQWDEARLLFRPWLEGTLTWHDFFIPHNEHRIAFTRLLDLLEVKLNGTWDIYLQTVVNAFIHIAYGCGLAAAIWYFTGRQRAGLICVVLLPLFALPFAAENTIHGFQSQFYFANIFSVVALLGLGFGKPCGKFWFIGLLAALGALFTMASGFLAAAAVIGLGLVRAIKKRAVSQPEVLTLLCALMVVALGLALKVEVAQHARFKPLSTGGLFLALLENLAWPMRNHPAMCLWFCLPVIILLAGYFRGRIKNIHGAEFVIGLGGWALLQALALAYGRAQIAESSRYLDSLSILTVANGAALFVLAVEADISIRWKKLNTALALLWVGVVCFGAVQSSILVADSFLNGTRGWGLAQVVTVRNFLAAPDAGVLRNAPREAVPYWSAEWLEEILRQPKLVALLPPETRLDSNSSKNGRLSEAAQFLVQQAVPILAIGLIFGLGLILLALRQTGRWVQGDGPAWVLAMLVLLSALGWTWSWRNLNQTTYAIPLYKTLTIVYANSGHAPEAMQFLKELLKVHPDDADAIEALKRLETGVVPKP